MVSLDFCLKWFINLICIALSVIGTLTLVVGIYSLILYKNMPEAGAYNLDVVPTLIIIFGCVLTITNICGSVEKKIYRLAYMVVMAILATITLILAIFAFATSRYVKENFSEMLTKWFNDDDGQFSGIETNYECCGLTGPDSYLGSLPQSCCPYRIDDLDPFNCTPIKAYQDGCLDSVARVFTSAYRSVGKACITISILGLAGSGATLFLLHLRKRR